MLEKCGIMGNEEELIKCIQEIPWEKSLSFGSIKIQIREGKATLVTVERTVKLD